MVSFAAIVILVHLLGSAVIVGRTSYRYRFERWQSARRLFIENGKLLVDAEDRLLKYRAIEARKSHFMSLVNRALDPTEIDLAIEPMDFNRLFRVSVGRCRYTVDLVQTPLDTPLCELMPVLERAGDVLARGLARTITRELAGQIADHYRRHPRPDWGRPWPLEHKPTEVEKNMRAYALMQSMGVPT